MVIDPSVHQPEISSFNHISSLTGISCTYHLPALTNEKSIDDELIHAELSSWAALHQFMINLNGKKGFPII